MMLNFCKPYESIFKIKKSFLIIFSFSYVVIFSQFYNQKRKACFYYSLFSWALFDYTHTKPHTTHTLSLSLFQFSTLSHATFPQPTTLTNQKHPTSPISHTPNQPQPKKNTQKNIFLFLNFFYFLKNAFCFFLFSLSLVSLSHSLLLSYLTTSMP